MMTAPWIHCFFLAFFLILSFIAAQSNYSQTTANLSTSWTNDESSIRSINFTDGSRIRIILSTNGYPTCGFFCNGSCTTYLFAIIINLYSLDIGWSNTILYKDIPEVLWSANRDYPVSYGAVLNLTAAGELVLHDVDGSIVWTTNTTGKSIAGMNLTDNGNLVLFDGHKSMVWQSFDHPTDCLVPGQKFSHGQKLISSVSSSNWTAQKDLFSFQLTANGLFAYVESNPPQVYYPSFGIDINFNNFLGRYVRFFNGSLFFFRDTSDYYPLQYVKLMPDGHLKAFNWNSSQGLTVVTDLLTGGLGECFYPLACGRNAICSGNEICSCPGTDHFRAVNDREPKMGCSQVTPLTCNATKDQDFIELNNIKYFTYTADMEGVDMETCKQACLEKCSCKAALFEYGSNNTYGDCYLPSELFTMTSVDAGVLPYNASAFIKVQNVRSTLSSKNSSKNHVAVVLGSTIGGSVLLIIVVIGFAKFIHQEQKLKSEIEEDFGIVLLEILCGRKNFDTSQPQESQHLLGVFQRCCEQGTLVNIIDRYSEEMQVHCTEVMEMMKVGSWCLQTDFTKRPSMSSVVKVLEGVMDVESNLDYNFLYPKLQKITDEDEKSSKPVLPSILSGPR
ncbi:hypothetical protein L2E82_07976 [Cichorium intybus]|uniref:Uncharacterized protein n=1 Tax=Cichorium intybus TaxID=13427 RepID=A0ACB9G5V5_CICIN|nr:hypothetical protein L2E82_07976 [Cichorium intybus]